MLPRTCLHNAPHLAQAARSRPITVLVVSVRVHLMFKYLLRVNFGGWWLYYLAFGACILARARLLLS